MKKGRVVEQDSLRLKEALETILEAVQTTKKRPTKYVEVISPLGRSQGEDIPKGELAAAFGRILREIRHEKGLSQDKLAHLCDIDRTYPSMLERGLRAPTLTLIFRLCDKLKCSPGEMVERVHKELKRVSG